MASYVDICNLALAQISEYQISDLSEQSKQARQCNRLYENVRDELLQKYPWRFARQRVTLSESSEEYDEWTYVYHYPSNCIRALWLYNASGRTKNPPEFVVVSNSAGTGKLILTDEYQAQLDYTQRTVTPQSFHPLFQMAYAMRLAERLVPSLTPSDTKLRNIHALYVESFEEAKQFDYAESYEDVKYPTDFISARE